MDILKARQKAREKKQAPTQQQDAEQKRHDEAQTEEGPPVMVSRTGEVSNPSRSH